MGDDRTSTAKRLSGRLVVINCEIPYNKNVNIIMKVSMGNEIYTKLKGMVNNR